MQKLRKLSIILLVAIISFSSFGFVYDMKMLTKEEIKKLKDEELPEVFTDVIIEKISAEAFHSKAGFAPKEFEDYRDLLRFIVELRKEFEFRKIDVPPVESWLK